MEVHLSEETQARLDGLVRASGRPAEEMVEDAVVGYLAALNRTRAKLDSRYDDMMSGRVKGVDGEEALAWLLAKTEEQRKQPV